MEKLISDLLLINETAFPFQTNRTLTEYVHQKSHQYGVPFSAESTCHVRLTVSYRCTFGGIHKCKVHKTNQSTCPTVIRENNLELSNRNYYFPASEIQYNTFTSS